MVGMNLLKSDILQSYPIYLDLLITNCYIYYWDSHLTDRFLIVPYFFSIWIAMTLTQAGGDHLNTQGGVCDNKNDPLGDRITRVLLLLYQDPFLLSSLFSLTSLLSSSLLPLSYLSFLLYSPTSLLFSSLLPLSYLSSFLFSPTTPPLSILS